MALCKECKFFAPIEWSEAGKCHFMPPIVDRWAHVMGESWCGQFQAADPSSDEEE